MRKGIPIKIEGVIPAIPENGITLYLAIEDIDGMLFGARLSDVRIEKDGSGTAYFYSRRFERLPENTRTPTIEIEILANKEDGTK